MFWRLFHDRGRKIGKKMILTWVVEKQTEMNPSYSVYCLSLRVFIKSALAFLACHWDNSVAVPWYPMKKRKTTATRKNQGVTLITTARTVLASMFEVAARPSRDPSRQVLPDLAAPPTWTLSSYHSGSDLRRWITSRWKFLHLYWLHADIACVNAFLSTAQRVRNREQKVAGFHSAPAHVGLLFNSTSLDCHHTHRVCSWI